MVLGVPRAEGLQCVSVGQLTCAYSCEERSQELRKGSPRVRKIIDMVATAEITISVNAHINLVCSARLDREPKRRGIARVKELLARGVNVISAQDDVNDPYYPFGKPDPLECASMIAHVAQLTLPKELEQVMDMITVSSARAETEA